jgi:hypothetical protein
LAHIDDRREIFEVREGEVKMIQEPALAQWRPRTPDQRHGRHRPLLLTSQGRL